MSSVTDDFVTVYPGIYTEREAPLVERFLADARALDERGPIDAVALAAGTLAPGTPGVGPVLPVTREMVAYNAAKYDPDNGVLNDAAVARRFGYVDVPALGVFAAHDDTFAAPYPVGARDTILVSQLNHEVDILAPVYPGDTLYLIIDRRTLTDRTPREGSVYRTVDLDSSGSVFNQRGEKVNSVIFRITESLRQYKPGRAPAEFSFAHAWDAPDWLSRPAHVYTDSDWDDIVAIWNGEQPQGESPLYWEDVSVGDRPRWTLDGPIDISVMPTDPYGMGTGGSRTLKHEILDPAVRSTMVRDAEGILRLPDARAHIPVVPEGIVSPLASTFDPGAIDTRDIHKEGNERSAVVNFLARELAIRHVMNWIGYHGRLRSIRWQIMSPGTMANYDKPVPEAVENPIHLAHDPELNDRDLDYHALTHDVGIVKSYVYDTSVRDGEFRAELAWRIEGIDGGIWAAGGATVALPSRAAGPVSHPVP